MIRNQHVLSGLARNRGLVGKLVIGTVGLTLEKMLMEPLVRPAGRMFNAALNPFGPAGPGAKLGQYIAHGNGGPRR